MRNKMFVAKEKEMNTAYVTQAKGMAKWLLKKEHLGPGDTIEAAAYRLQTKYGVPVSFLMRLRHREIHDMLVSNLVALTKAYQAATLKMERAYEHEQKMAVDPFILRLADFVAGSEDQKGDEQ